MSEHVHTDDWERRYGLTWYGPRNIETFAHREWPAVVYDGPGIAIRIDVNHRLDKRFLQMALSTAINQIHREVHDHIHSFTPPGHYPSTESTTPSTQEKS